MAVPQPQAAAPPRPPHHPPKRAVFIRFVGKGAGTTRFFDVLCGENPPTITGGYAKWTTVDRPLQRGLTVFQGYDPVQMKLEIRFGRWTENFSWHIDNATGEKNEEDMQHLEWMAGANWPGGQPPYVYLNTYGPLGGTTNLIPSAYQQTLGINGPLADGRPWPWVISGIEWGKSYRNSSGYRIYQEATVTVLNYQSPNAVPQHSLRGGYFTSAPGHDTIKLLAAAPSGGPPLYPSVLAGRIANDHKNNPVKNSHLYLQHWPWGKRITHGRQIWIPAHQV